METKPLWLDTDIGNDIDDAVALAYLLRQKRCRLVGVSTVTGVVEDRSRIAAAVARAAGRREVPIFSGYGEPLSGPGQPEVPQAAALTVEERSRRFPADPQAALAALMDAARAAPGELTLLTIGPLTNAARFFQAEPELPSLLGEMVLMAGRFWREKPEAEWNVLCDPEAGRIVAEAPVRRTWYGLDVTLQCMMAADEVRRRFTGEPLATVARFAEVYFRKRDRITFHDPLAAACVFEPDLCTYEPGRVKVETGGEHPGRTIPRAAAEGAPADRLARTVDALYAEASDILGIHVYSFHGNLKFYPDHAALNEIFQNYFHEDFPQYSFYLHERATLYSSLPDLTLGMLGHEIAHAIISHYFVIPPPARVQEILSGYVEYNLRKSAGTLP